MIGQRPLIAALIILNEKLKERYELKLQKFLFNQLNANWCITTIILFIIQNKYYF